MSSVPVTAVQSTKGDFVPRSRINLTDFIGAGHPRPQARRAARRRRRHISEPISSWFEFRLTDVDSLGTCVDHLGAFPDDCFSKEYGAFWETFRSVLGDTQNHFVSDGASFSVNITTHRQLDAGLTGRLPEMSLKKHKIIATKVPKIEQTPTGSHQSLEGVKEDSLKAVAWESHCLFHPPVRKSENIVELLGLCWESVEVQTTSGSVRTPVPALIMECADEGTLDDLLQSGESIAFALKMKLGLDVARGLETLHESGLVHCDLKANNVLLFRCNTQLLTAKVSDFGCATHSFGPDEACLLPPYWPRWDAPEARPRKSPVDMQDLPKVDVYSFGLLMWQIVFDGRTPFDRKRALSPLFMRVPQFALIIATDTSGFKEKELAIGNLKDQDNDDMLRGVQASIRLLGLQSSQLDNVIAHTLRRDSRQRESMSQIVEDFKRSTEER
jgi:serine/threonine protein kinase